MSSRVFSGWLCALCLLSAAIQAHGQAPGGGVMPPPDAAPAVTQAAGPQAVSASVPAPVPASAQPPQSEVKKTDRSYTIALVEDGACAYARRSLALVRKELEALVGDQRGIVFKEDPAFDGKWDAAQVAKALDAALQDPQVDLVLADGLLLAQLAADPARTLPKPVIGTFVPDPTTMGLTITREGKSGRKNFTFVAVPMRSQRDLEVLRQIVPFKKLGLFADGFVIETMKGLKDQLAVLEKNMGITVELIPMNTSAAEVLERLDRFVDAVYLTPPLRMGSSEWAKLIEGLNARKLPTFSMMGREDVDLGVLAGLAVKDDDRLARRLALNIQQIMQGTPPEDLLVILALDEKLQINTRTAMAIGYAPSFDIMVSADFLFENLLVQGDPLSLGQAFRIAREHSSDLAIKQAETDVYRQDRNRVRGSFMPQVTANATYVQVDRDQAESSMGMQAEKQTKGGFQITQVLFNDPLITQFRMANRSWKSQIEQGEDTRMDVMESAGKAYIQFLQARALFRIETDNLGLSRNNLDLARVREQIGVAGPEEVYRWETQVASQKAQVISASRDSDLARLSLNRILGVDIARRWIPEDIVMTGTNYYFLDGRLESSLRNSRDLRVFEEYVVQCSLGNTPMLKSLDLVIDAQRLYLDQTRRRFVLPELAASFSFDHTFDRQMAGDTSGQGGQPADSKDDQWNVGLQASLPVFEGGKQVADFFGAKARLEQNVQTRRRAGELVEQQARSVMSSLGSSYPSMQLQRVAADFAERNFKLVQEKYARGSVSIVDLLDAQNQSFVANQNATIAGYRFLEDLVALQRVVAWFEFEKSEAEKDQWVRGFQQFSAGAQFDAATPWGYPGVGR